MRRRLLAAFALVVGAATVVLALVVAVSQFPRGLVLLGCVLIAAASAWYGVLRGGTARLVGLVAAGLLSSALSSSSSWAVRGWSTCWSWWASW